MPTETLAAEAGLGWRRGWPEALVGLLAAIIFLGCLGSVDVWGKREQRASAEVLDTVEHHHWLLAEIQGRPRLEKPPLPRWTVAALMLATGRRDEVVIRLPGALCALGTVALISALGRRMGGRPLGLAAALILCSSGLFVGEMRQAGNDAPLAFFTTLALYSAWRLLDEDEPGRARSWRLLFCSALGLGFLSKGPVVLMLTCVAIVPYLLQGRRLRSGLRRLFDIPGLLVLAAMVTSWPAVVAWHDPNAPGVWLLEMSEKTGILGTLVHHRHALLAQYWPAMTFPWSVVAMAALVVPFLSRTSSTDGVATPSSESPRTLGPSPIWFAWWWAVGNMAVFCLWTVAKPNYYLPCAPGMALLTGAGWIRLSRRARDASAGWGRSLARLLLQAQWVLLFVVGVLLPIALEPWIPRPLWPLTTVPAVALTAGVVVSAWAWRRGSDAMTLAPIVAALAVGVVLLYGILAPADNPRRSHRALADTLGRLVPPAAGAIHFYYQVDEGLGFYLRGLDLQPVPGTQPRYSTAYDLAAAHRAGQAGRDTSELLDARREAIEKQALLRWLDRADPASAYLLIRSSLYDRYAPDLAGRVTPVFRESGLDRNELVLLHVDARPPLAASGQPIRR